MPFSGSKAIRLLLYPASHIYVLYSIPVKKKLFKLLRQEKLTIPAYSVFFDYGFVQHSRYGWQSSHNLRYHTYLNVSTLDLKDAVAFAYGASLPAVKQPAPDSTKKKWNRMLAEPVRPMVRTGQRVMTSPTKEKA